MLNTNLSLKLQALIEAWLCTKPGLTTIKRYDEIEDFVGELAENAERWETLVATDAADFSWATDARNAYPDSLVDNVDTLVQRKRTSGF